MGAALYMAMSCALLRAYTGEHPNNPELACQAVNERLLAYATADQFVTVFLGILDPQSGTLVYSNAGHNPPILLRPSQPDQAQLLRNTGLPLGVSEEGTWQSKNVQLAPGDVLVIYTDGMTDAESADGDFYDLSRLVDAAAKNAGSDGVGNARRHPGRCARLHTRRNAVRRYGSYGARSPVSDCQEMSSRCGSVGDRPERELNDEQ